MTFEIKMTQEEIIDGLRSTYGKEFTAADVRGFCAANDIAYQTVTKKIKQFSVGRGKLSKKDFKKKVKKIGIKNKQDSVLTQPKKTATLHRTRKGGLDKKGENVGRFKPQGKNPYGQSQIKGKTFSYGD